MTYTDVHVYAHVYVRMHACMRMLVHAYAIMHELRML